MSGPAPSIDHVRPASRPRLEVRWEPTGWDDPRIAALRAEMNAELHPRYAKPDGSPRDFPPAPLADEVLVSWLALVDGIPAATASLRRLAVDGEPLRFEVKRVFVGQPFRRNGLAAASLRRVEAGAREFGIERLVLQTGHRQPEAVGLYEREGWSRIPIYPPYDIAPQSRCFAKDL